MPARVVPSNRLIIPQPVAARVSRPGLVDRMERARQSLGLVAAPAGFGKTTALAEWARTTDAGVAWLSCDVSDEDPSLFWTDLIASISSRWPGAGDDAALVLERRPDAERELVTSLSSDLADIDGSEVIVVDDVQFARPAQAALFSLIRSLPSQARLVLGSRRDPAFSLARLRVDQRLFELRAADLAFSRHETAALFDLAGLSIADSDLDRLHLLNEGWPGGLQLAILALRGAGDARRVIDALASTTRTVNDYLLNEVLDRLPADLVEFVTVIAVLEEFDAALCLAVTDDPSTERLLGELVSADLFVVQLDPVGARFRFHHLFRAFLRARLRRLGQERLREAQERAIGALEEGGEHLAALRLAMDSGETARAALIVNTTVFTSLAVSDEQVSTTAIRAWLRQYGREAAESNPEQLLPLLVALAQFGQPDVAGWLERVEQAHPDPDPYLSAFLHGTWAEYHLARGDPDHAFPHNQLAAEASREATRHHPLFAALPVQRARGYLMAGDATGIAAVLESVSAPVGHPIVDDVRLPALHAWVALQSGDLRLARRTADDVLDTGPRVGAPPHGIGMILATLVSAALDLEGGKFASAEWLLGATESAARLNGQTGLHSLICLWLARLATAKGDQSAAWAYLTEARFAFVAPSSTVTAGFAAEEMRQAIAFVPPHGARLLSQLPDRVDSTVLRARLAVAQEDPALAAELLDGLDARTMRERVEVGVLRAILAVHHQDAAHAHLREALLLAEPQGFYRTILEQGNAVIGLLQSFPADGRLASYVELLVTMGHGMSWAHVPSRPTYGPPRAETAPQPARPRALTTFVEQLSPREVTVLQYLPSRLTYQEIGAELFISTNTVKTHTKHVYRKLGVTTRREAVDTARASNLI